MAGIAPGIPFVHVRPNDEPDVTCKLVVPEGASSEGLECVVQHTAIANGGEQAVAAALFIIPLISLLIFFMWSDRRNK